MVSAQARREQVDYAVSRGTSVRHSCALLDVSRSALRYESRMPACDAELEVQLTEISRAHPEYGHRMARGVLQLEGPPINPKRVRCPATPSLAR
jgi:putative transposase